MLPSPLCLVSCYPVHMKENLKKLFRLYYSPSPKPSNDFTCDLKTKSMLPALMVKAPQDLTGWVSHGWSLGFQATQPCLYPAWGLLCNPKVSVSSGLSLKVLFNLQVISYHFVAILSIIMLVAENSVDIIWFQPKLPPTFGRLLGLSLAVKSRK